MRNLWLVASSTYRRRARSGLFLVLTFGLPIIIVIVAFVELAGSTPRQDLTSVGYVDETGRLGRITQVETSSGPLAVTAYPSVAAAGAAVAAGTIDGYLVVPPGYFGGADATYYGTGSPNAPEQDALATVLRQAILPDAQPATLTRIGDPLNLTYTDAATGQSVGEGLPQSLYQATPAILAIVFVVAVSMGSNQLGSAVVREKDQRAMEMVITSVAPWELVAGKVAGMALLSLTQVAVWLALGVASIALIVGSEPQPMAIVVPWHAILWAALLCVPGYFLYAAVAAGLGIVAGDAQQARQLAGLLGLVLMLSFVSLATIAGQPDSGLALALTYFPLTSPIIALIRMAIVSVPEAQLVTALVILLVSLALAIWAATRIFVAAMLLYGQSLAPAQILRALRGRALRRARG